MHSLFMMLIFRPWYSAASVTEIRLEATMRTVRWLSGHSVTGS